MAAAPVSKVREDAGGKPGSRHRTAKNKLPEMRAVFHTLKSVQFCTVFALATGFTATKIRLLDIGATIGAPNLLPIARIVRGGGEFRQAGR
jgi:hypothetical protein